MCCIMGYAGHDLPKETFTEYLLRTTSRGPDDQRVAETEFGLLGFGRLAIMGLTPEGMQPFFRGADCVACNGELYGFRPVKAELEAEGYTFESDSDCEIILPLYYKYGLDMFRHLDAEFAMILYDSRKKLLMADAVGIPLENMRQVKVDNCGVCEIELHKGEPSKLITWNERGFLMRKGLI